MIPPSNAVVASQRRAQGLGMVWLTISYFFQTIGELSLSPVGSSR